MKNTTLKIVKIGGKLIEDELKFQEFLKDFAALKNPKILVHGGGNFATEIAGKLGYKTRMVDGRRITDSNSMQVITMVYGGLINKNMVAKLQGLNCNALGLSGADGRSILSRKRPVEPVDYGFVGDIEKVNTTFISFLVQQEITLVFSAISCTKDGQLLNTNADSIAAEIAKAMSQEFESELYFCFEKKGVLADAADDNSVIEQINEEKYQELLREKIISDGMLPKLHNSFQALKRGVSKVILGDFTLLKEKTIHTKIIK